jgi:hypothetical protein
MHAPALDRAKLRKAPNNRIKRHSSSERGRRGGGRVMRHVLAGERELNLRGSAIGKAQREAACASPDRDFAFSAVRIPERSAPARPGKVGPYLRAAIRLRQHGYSVIGQAHDRKPVFAGARLNTVQKLLVLPIPLVH